MLYIGLMSGTSLDGVDGALVDFSDEGVRSLGDAYIPFPASLRSDLMALQGPGQNEIEREALAANALVRHYADCVPCCSSKQTSAPTPSPPSARTGKPSATAPNWVLRAS